MNHNDIRHKLSDYIDNAVSAGERSAIELHLAACDECSNALEELRRTIEQVQEIEEIESPAWMTGKIMAKVRAEADQKQTIFQRLFYPLWVKLPIRTVAVLFLAVTAYYMYQNIDPSERYPAEPMGTSAQKDAPSPSSIGKKEKVLPAPAPEAKKLDQEPGYRSLDMKYSYEQPAPPTPLKEAAAPAPTAPAQTQASGGAASGMEESEIMRSAAPETAHDKTELPAGSAAEKKAKSPAKAHSMILPAVSDAPKIILSIAVKDLKETEEAIDRIIGDLKGTVTHKATISDSLVISATLEAAMAGRLREQLATLGKVREKGPAPETQAGKLQFEITVTSITPSEK
ncbi:MAG: DUF2275 domain-containing protein [Nitrospirota bacterium]|nr:DUF2275 domain-containing protein [Nitrospirota bacterium]